MDRMCSSEAKGEQTPFLESHINTPSIALSKTDPSGHHVSLANTNTDDHHRFTEASPFGVKNFASSSSSYGATEDTSLSLTALSSSSTLDSDAELHSSSYQPEGVLFRISDIHSEQTLQKQLREVIARLSCRPAEVDLEEDTEPTPQRDALLELEGYHELYGEYELPQHAASFDFSSLLHDLYKLQGRFAPAHFREHASAAIKKKNAEKAELQEILAAKKRCWDEIHQHPTSHEEDFSKISDTLQKEIAHLEKKLAFLDVFIAYHQKALAVNNYLECYNHLDFYHHHSSGSERRFARFEEATQKLQPALAYSQKANQALLDCIPETNNNKLARDIFKKIAGRDFEENPFEVALCPGGRDFTPTTQANQWTCQRLQRDLRLSLKEGHCSDPSGCVIQ
jgi:hypothetical protein